MQRKQYFLLIVLALLIGAATWLWLANRSPRSTVALPSAAPHAGAMPVSFPAPSFALEDQNHNKVSDQSLRGKVWIVDFIFTNCANTCPIMTAKRTELQKQITDPRVTFVSFTVDPQRDNAETRKAYATKNQIDESRWHFVAPADADAAMRLARSMKIVGEPREHDNPILHADRFILVDTAGQVRGTYHSADEGAMQRLVSDAKALTRETPVVH